jgi:hypothetical protein
MAQIPDHGRVQRDVIAAGAPSPVAATYGDAALRHNCRITAPAMRKMHALLEMLTFSHS